MEQRMSGIRDLRLVQGGGDVVTQLEQLLARARAGEIDGVVTCVAYSDNKTGWAWSHRDDMPAACARLHLAVSFALHDLNTSGLV